MRGLARPLDADLRRRSLSGPDAALATRLAYEVVRRWRGLDATLDKHCHRKSNIEPYTRSALRVGAYQLLCMDRIPGHAAIATTVEALKKERGVRPRRFC